MYFNKFPYISNFEFLSSSKAKTRENGYSWLANHFDCKSGMNSSEEISVEIKSLENDIYTITAISSEWNEYLAQSELQLPPEAKNDGFSDLILGDGFQIQLKSRNGHVILSSVADQSFGKAGEAHLFQFLKPNDVRFYGMGEKMFGLELSGIKTKFWNTDAWADFHHLQIVQERPDPYYVSIPYLIMKCGDYWVGLLLDNPEATFIKTNNHIQIAGQMDALEQKKLESVLLGSEGGQPRLIVMVAQSLAELTRKHQTLVGRTPLPPAWSLGYQQCRWGYESMADLNYLDAGMNKNEIPCDGFWLDIEYMDGYRVFTYEDKNFPDPKKNLDDIQSRGRRVVPIIDPGVKAEAGYSVYDSGKAGDHFCKNPQGQDFIGLVWPGETVFPDFSLEDARQWWADQVKTFAETGITAAWLDMNDPATGDSLNDLMRFDKGRRDHKTFHNQYAMGMARATREGFQKVRPDERVFLLSRSGFTGMAKYAAIWTGDNVSNYHYLKCSIPCTLNLALSGIPFNGPDVGGFGNDSSPQLMKDWIKTGFLFPFLRNHSVKNSHNQEPWSFDQSTMRVFRHYVRLRYRLRPYLYNLFIDQAERGEAIMRPIFYNFTDEKAFDFSRTEDEFMVGPTVLQAPFVNEDQQERDVLLPSCNWYDVENKQWLSGGQKVTVQKNDWTTPLYFRNESILAIARNEGGDHQFNAKVVDLHLIIKAEDQNQAELSYRFDDGLSYNYQRGERSQLDVKAIVDGKILKITTNLSQKGFGDADVRFVTYDDFDAVLVNGRQIEIKSHSFQWTHEDAGLKIGS